MQIPKKVRFAKKPYLVTYINDNYNDNNTYKIIFLLFLLSIIIFICR